MALQLPSSDQEFLMRMGLIPGAEVEVVRKGPMNGPMIYRVQGADVALRRGTAQLILVNTCENRTQETE